MRMNLSVWPIIFSGKQLIDLRQHRTIQA